MKRRELYQVFGALQRAENIILDAVPAGVRQQAVMAAVRLAKQLVRNYLEAKS